MLNPLPDDAPFSEEWHATPPTVGDDLIFDEPLFGDEPFPDAPFSEEWHATRRWPAQLSLPMQRGKPPHPSLRAQHGDRVGMQ